MIIAQPEDVRFALVTGLAIGGLVGLLVGICIHKTRKPPMASRTTTFFASHGRTRNWKLPPAAR